ncbi:tail protein [Dinoroseobacter phage vB_DshP-R7L]|uniref:Sialate O-acetylesterase n=1 Tax=Dinoroseobacter phage vB_DshP-R7L TaxID=2873349 RepID=A0AAE8XFK0_9CAUD|nr:tail protein [Dinoroseobacter phage vB_DshP-R7L]UAT28878.1 sialate O-acetylesterase [Dinoroseobacter phage vB_DshP-R7L]
MAERRPLVLVNGELQELPTGDTLPGAGGVQNNFAATTDPAVGNDNTEGYTVGSVWVNTTADTAWVCLDASTGAAVWTESTAAGGGGASIFTALTDTPAAYTGQAGKMLIVNPGETALEFDDVPAGGGGASGTLSNVYVEDQGSTTGYSGTNSVTGAATKGNRVRTQFSVDLKTVTFEANEATPETYEAVVAEVSGSTVGAIIGRASTLSTGGSDELVTMTFATPLRLVPGTDYFILITQTGGTGSTALDSAAGVDAMTGVISSYALGGYITDNDIQGGENFTSFGSSYVAMDLVYDIVFVADGIGSGILSGTVDPTTEGKDGDFYYRTDTNTIFGPKASGTWPAGVSLVGPAGAAGTNGTDGADGNGVVPVYSSQTIEPPVGTTASVSTAATKANFLTALIGMRITHVNVRVDTSHAGEVFAAVVSGKTTSDTVLSIQKGTYASLTTGTGVDNNIALAAPLEVNAGDIVLIGITRTDGTGTANPGIYFETSASYESVYYTKGAGSANLRIEDNDITVGQALTGATFFNDNWTAGFTYELLSGALPIGGSIGQILAKVDGTNYNTEWIDAPSGGSSSMVQTEITATAYSTVNGDFAGNVVRRMNNAATQTVTVEPSMTGGQPVTFIRTGAGAVTFAAGTGVTIHSINSLLSIDSQYGSVSLIPDATTANTYYLIGNLA